MARSACRRRRAGHRVFTIFVAEYAQLRSELTRAERQLSLTAAGRLTAGNLGRQVLLEAVLAAIVGCVASFVGAVVPLLIGAVTKPYSWSAVAVSVAGLGALGAGLAKAVSGRLLRWVVVMTAMGVLVASSAWCSTSPETRPGLHQSQTERPPARTAVAVEDPTLITE